SSHGKLARAFNRSIGIRAGLDLIAQSKLPRKFFLRRRFADGGLYRIICAAFISSWGHLPAVLGSTELPSRIVPIGNQRRSLSPSFEGKCCKANKEYKSHD